MLGKKECPGAGMTTQSSGSNLILYGKKLPGSRTLLILSADEARRAGLGFGSSTSYVEVEDCWANDCIRSEHSSYGEHLECV